MKMTFRWYGEDDPVTLEKIRQIPGMTGIVSAIYDIPVGEEWPVERIMKLKETVENAGLELSVIESVPVHEDIKMGCGDRDRYIENYCKTLRNLSKAGIDCVCYNFMPILMKNSSKRLLSNFNRSLDVQSMMLGSSTITMQ